MIETKDDITTITCDKCGHSQDAPSDKYNGLNYPECRAINYIRHPDTGSKVVLTTAHLDGDKTNNRFKNLRRLCQRCHLAHDLGHHVMNRKYGRKHSGKHQTKLF